MPMPKDPEAAEERSLTTGPLYIFEHTLAEVQANHYQSEYFLDLPSRQDQDSMLPLVKDVFELACDKDRCPNGVLMHIELKVPQDERIRSRYRNVQAVTHLHKLIEAYGLAEYCMVQSFDHETLREFER